MALPNSNDKLLVQAVSEKDAIAYIDCVFHRRYAEHLPLSTLLCDMRHLKNRNVLSYVGAMSFCQRAFLRTRTHLYRIANQEIHLLPYDYRHSLMNLVDYINARTNTTMGDLYSFCTVAHPALVKSGECGIGLTAFRRFIDQHPSIFEIIQPSPLEIDQQQMTSLAVVVADVLLFPKIKIAVGRVVNINGNTAYLECQGEFVSFSSSNAGFSPSEQLKTYLTKGDLVPFLARYSPDTANGVGGPVILAVAGVSSTKLRNVWKALTVELPRNAVSVCEHSSGKYLSPCRYTGNGQSSYTAPLDDYVEWYSRRYSAVGQKRDSSTSSLAAVSGPPGTASMGGGIGGLLTPPFSTLFSKQLNPFTIDAETQAGSGRPYVDKAVQTEVTDEELMLRFIRKYPNLLDNLK